ncbi:hypothetical protein [Burkholderia plantarii]|uniref:hypothetical protein n=1 Tax=Burkholderia plantarii TaxID=41899 RepID=UPI0007060725|nr:hypothetical protein [Burkholderia plantarii]ALK31393.1 hypothetical protein bpln_1g26270 [Burkholderia plantarii]GLZ22652.1 hypothetical protein Bpla01_61810 [Burkholderia plantarii]
MIKDISTLIEALTKAAWPILGFFLVWRFHDEIGLILRRVADFKKGKLFGQEVEMEDKLDRLEGSAVAVVEKVAAIPPEQDTVYANLASAQFDYLVEAARSPRAAFMLLSADVEREATIVLARTGQLRGRTAVPLATAMQEISGLVSFGLSDVLELLSQFRSVRNAIVHGQAIVTESEIFRAIDSGLKLLKALKAVPSEKHTVKHANFPLFADANCTIPFPEATGRQVFGLMLESEEPSTGNKFDRVFPSTNRSYKIGEQLSWEWEPNRVYGQAWYRHPTDGTPTKAWDQSMEFAGRPLDKI